MNLHKLPLNDLKVLELEGLAPTVFCGMILADYGADVIVINQPKGMKIGIPSSQNFMYIT